MPYSLGDAVGYIKLNIKEFEENYRQVLNDAKQLDTASSVMGAGFQAASKAMVAAFASVTTAAGVALKSVVQVGSSYQAAMSQVAATMGMSAEEVANNSEAYQQLSASAKEMGATTKFSATQAAEALNYLALAGYSVDESISSLPKILDVAAAGGMDLAKASDMVTDAMSALGIPLEEMNSFVDKLARTSQRSNTSVSQLGEAILQIGGTAKSLAGGVTELDTALGILANNGIKAAEGGTALRQIILNLTAPTEKAAEYMASIGFSAYDAAGNIKPLNQVFSELSNIISQFDTQQQQDNVITSIFDARQLKSARALLSGYGQSWDNLYNEIENANGAAHRMAETMQENLTGAVTIAKSAIEGVQVTAFEALENGLTKSVKTATGAIDELNKTLQTPEMQEALNKIGNMLGDVLVKFAQFVANEAIPNSIKWFSKLQEVADGLKSALTGLIVALPLFTIAVATTNNSISIFIAKQIAAKTAILATNAALLANPFTAVAALLAVLTTAIVAHVKEQKKLYDETVNQTTAFSEAADAARESANALQGYKNAAGAITNEVTEQINEIRTLCNDLGEYARQTSLTSEELSTAQTIIERLNELYPQNTAYIEDGQIKGYEGLATAIGNYTEQLYYAKKLEGEQEVYFGARDTLEQTKKDLKEYEELFADADAEYKKWKRKIDTYYSGVNMFSYMDEQEAYKQGYNSVISYLNAQYDAAEKNLDNINSAIMTTRETMVNAEDTIKESEQNMLDYRIKSGEKIEGIYSSQAEAVADVARKQGEEMANRERELHKDEIEAAEKVAEEKIEAYDKMWDDIAELDKKWQLRQIGSEEEYQRQRKELLESNRNEDDEKWVKEYNKSLVYIENQNKIIQEEITRKQQEEADKREQIAEEQKNKEIRKAQNAFSAWQKSYDDLVIEAESAYSEIQNNQQRLTQTLIGSVKLYETETKKVWDKQKRQYEEQDIMKVSAKSLQEQIKATEEYQQKLDSLIDSGLSQNVLGEIFSMSEDEQKQYVEALSKLSQAELQEYSKSYDDLYQNTKEYTDKIYAQQLETFKNDYAGKFDAIFEQVPENLKLVGEESIDGFLQGIESKKDESTGAMKNVMEGVLAQAKEALDIHSPSKKFEEVGSNTIQGFIQGIMSKFNVVYDSFKVLGEESGNNFVSGFKLAWDKFKQTMQTDLALQNVGGYSASVASSFNKPMVNGWQNQSGGYGELNSVISQLANNQMQQGKNLTKADVIDAIKQAAPDGNIVFQIDGRPFAIIARKELNSLAQESGKLNLKG